MNTENKNMTLWDLQLFADASAQLQNTTTTTGMKPEIKTYYERRLIELAEPKLVHDQFGDSYPIPANNGKTIEFRKYDSLPKATTALTEGVTPEGQAMTVTTITWRRWTTTLCRRPSCWPARRAEPLTPLCGT